MSDVEPSGHFLVYRDEAGNARIDVRFDGDTVWLTQAQLVDLFDSSKANISEHIANIIDEGELAAEATVRGFRTVRQEGSRQVRRSLTHYNLDMIISVGYRVRSKTATAFRIWATQRLREFIVKGFVLDDERLKNPDLPFDYFDELLQRIQDIRTSERRFYQKITDVYATSIDYDSAAEITKAFFATVQNKLHWAITGQTAAEVVRDRADSAKPNMGLTSWRGDRIRAADIAVAKNYYTEDELRALNNLVEQYLVFAEGQAQRHIPMRMADWLTKLDAFLTLNDRDILTSAGRVSAELAKQHAAGEFERYKHRAGAEVESDFDRFSKRVIGRHASPPAEEP
ncbi:hydroxyacid dehydrogenase [Pseudactinotalea sp. HY160]|uniref:virulence RhuM family protein n=1 Tax=Pseudactinotalea sp. HY160 TaxID=2654490 RepID=UPI00128E03D8|nr:virulence RhuM family protein [Pseudactinotalea sp. HY160]MPV48647.1 hydroxyacid dehydrogenase [Pseudactinotalea sp. HY160]